MSLLLKEEGRIARLVLNRPERLNALDQPLADGFRAAVARLRKSEARVVVLTGAGRAFSAGGDLGFIEGNRQLAISVLKPRMRAFYRSFLSMRSLSIPVIAQINGTAVGAGLCLALSCDLRTVLADAPLALNFVRLGLAPGMGAWPLARAVFGDARARELLLTGREFRGSDLAAWGGAVLAARDTGELERETNALAETLAAASPIAVRALREEQLAGESLSKLLEVEARTQAASFKKADLAEGLAALRERRPPRF